MTSGLPAAAHALLEKAARDNGFDLGPTVDGTWLAFSSTQAPARIWLAALEDRLIAAMDRNDVERELAELGEAMTVPLPAGARAARSVATLPRLHDLVRRIFVLSRTLPTRLLDDFQARTAALPRTTEAERWVVQRVGQDCFRAGLVEYWNGRCCMTGLAIVPLLRASHIKPWADCDSDAERLDVFNGLLLAPHLDAAFDSGLISVAEDGSVLISPKLDGVSRQLLSLDKPLVINRLTHHHQRYLDGHREKWHRGAGA